MYLVVVLMAVAIVIATIVALTSGARAAGWLLMASGIVLLVDAAVTIYRIHANNGQTDAGSFYGLFAIIPAGAILSVFGSLVLCIRKCGRKSNGTFLSNK